MKVLERNRKIKIRKTENKKKKVEEMNGCKIKKKQKKMILLW